MNDGLLYLSFISRQTNKHFHPICLFAQVLVFETDKVHLIQLWMNKSNQTQQNNKLIIWAHATEYSCKFPIHFHVNGRDASHFSVKTLKHLLEFNFMYNKNRCNFLVALELFDIFTVCTRVCYFIHFICFRWFILKYKRVFQPTALILRASTHI